MNYFKKKRLYKPGQSQPFKLSRTKIELFKDCPCCFYLDRVQGLSRPRGPRFLINLAIDAILKREFDDYRASQKVPPLLTDFAIKAVPHDCPEIDDWRNPFVGLSYHHQATGLTVFGGVDDIWRLTDNDQLAVVEYKATAKAGRISQLDPPGSYHDSYRRQIEIYQWLMRQNQLPVAETGYFVYVNGDLDQDRLNPKGSKARSRSARLDLKIEIFAYQPADLNWINSILVSIKNCLDQSQPPARSVDCSHCDYARARVQRYQDYLIQAGLSND